MIAHSITGNAVRASVKHAAAVSAMRKLFSEVSNHEVLGVPLKRSISEIALDAMNIGMRQAMYMDRAVLISRRT